MNLPKPRFPSLAPEAADKLIRVSPATLLAFLLSLVIAKAQAPDFAHPDSPHVMNKNPFATLNQTDQLDFMGFRLGTKPLMVLLLEFPDSSHNSELTHGYFEDLVFGADPSINGYYKEISYGKFSFTNAGVNGWYMASRPAAYYFDAAQKESQYPMLAAEAVQAAISAGVDFSKYDGNNDKKVTRDELLVLLILADHPFLGKPNLMATRFDQLQSRGVSAPGGLAVDTWAVRVEENIDSGGVRQQQKGVYITYYAHELAHLALALPDLYDDTFGGDQSGQFDLMATSWTVYTPHISPWAKIHLGWITPTVVTQDGWHSIRDAATHPEAYLLHDPAHGVNEYYLVENRWPPNSKYENVGDNPSARDRGLAIWHITEFYDHETFNFLKGRKMVGMKWAGGPNSLNVFPYTALWDCSQPASCYDFTDDSSPRNARWADGRPSGIKITGIPAAGETMRVYFSVPGFPAAPVITVQPQSKTAVAGETVSFQATVTGGAPLSYQWRFEGANIRGATNVTLTLTNVLALNAGSYSVLVSNPAGSLLSDAATLSVAKREQSIVFGVLSNRIFGDAPFPVSVTASSGLPVSLRVISGPATLSDNTITLTGAGTVVIRASQAGNANFNAAVDVDRSFNVAKANQTITFASVGDKSIGDAPLTLGAAASSGLPVSFSVLSGPATISGNALTLTGAGLVTVRASQEGNANYTPAPSVDQSFTVAPASQPPTAKLSVSSITVAGGKSHELEIRYSDDKAIRLFTLDSGDIRVTGPNGFDQLAALDYVDIGGDGTPRTGYYHINAPGGVWDSADNGAYTVLMESNQVSDTSNEFVVAGVLGTFEVNVPIPQTLVARPPNDDFTNRIQLAGASIAAAGSNIDASKETGEPNHAGKPATRSVWWSWTAPESGAVTISTSGSRIDTLLGVYTGATLASLVPVASNDDDPEGGSTSRVTFRAEAGTEYQIAVDAFGGEAGSIKLSLMVEIPRASMRVELSGKNLVLSWLAQATGFVLEATDNLATPVWTQVSVTPVLVGETFSVKVPISGGSRVFRLRRQ